jgi:hypothetical protein
LRGIAFPEQLPDNERRSDFIKLLPNNYKKDTYTDTSTDGGGGFTKDAVLMGSVAMTYVPSFTEIGYYIQKFTRGVPADVFSLHIFTPKVVGV